METALQVPGKVEGKDPEGAAPYASTMLLRNLHKAKNVPNRLYRPEARHKKEVARVPPPGFKLTLLRLTLTLWRGAAWEEDHGHDLRYLAAGGVDAGAEGVAGVATDSASCRNPLDV